MTQTKMKKKKGGGRKPMISRARARDKEKGKKKKNAFSREFAIFSASNKHERAYSHRVSNAANSGEEISREWRHLNNRVIERARFFEIFGRLRDRGRGKEMRFDERIETTKVCIVLLSRVCIYSSWIEISWREVECASKWNKESEGKINWETRRWYADVVKKNNSNNFIGISKLPRIMGRIIDRVHWMASHALSRLRLDIPNRYSVSSNERSFPFLPYWDPCRGINHQDNRLYSFSACRIPLWIIISFRKNIKISTTKDYQKKKKERQMVSKQRKHAVVSSIHLPTSHS